MTLWDALSSQGLGVVHLMSHPSQELSFVVKEDCPLQVLMPLDSQSPSLDKPCTNVLSHHPDASRKSWVCTYSLVRYHRDTDKGHGEKFPLLLTRSREALSCILNTHSAAKEVADISKLLSRQPKHKYKPLRDPIRKQFFKHTDPKEIGYPSPPCLLSVSISALATCQCVRKIRTGKLSTFEVKTAATILFLFAFENVRWGGCCF